MTDDRSSEKPQAQWSPLVEDEDDGGVDTVADDAVADPEDGADEPDVEAHGRPFN